MVTNCEQMNKKTTAITIAILLLSSLPLGYAMVKGDGTFDPLTDNVMGFSEPTHVTYGQTFRYDVYGDIHWPIDTIAADNMSFLPAGIIYYSDTAKGNLFNDSHTAIWMEPTGDDIRNSDGYAKPFVWSIDAQLYPRLNDTNASAFNITWTANNCGLATLTIVSGGTASDGIDYGTTKLQGTVYVHPRFPTGFTATPISPNRIDLSWTKYTSMDKTLVRYKTGSNPTSVTDGALLYNGTDITTSHLGLSLGDHIYYSAWGWNDTAGYYSLTYDIGDATTLSGNNPPDIPTLIHPANTSNYESVYNQYLTAHVTDPDGNSMNVSLYWEDGTLIAMMVGVINDTDANLSLPPYVDPNWLMHRDHSPGTYQWYAVANDSLLETRSETYNFKTSISYDCNEDQLCNYLDVSAVSGNYLTWSGQPGEIGADITGTGLGVNFGDGIVNYLDVSAVAGHYLVPIPL